MTNPARETVNAKGANPAHDPPKIKKVKSKIFVLGLLWLSVSCTDPLVYSEFSSLQEAQWQRSDTLQFDMPITDTINAHHLYINLRNNESYPFSNLFLITTFRGPSGETAVDTLEYEMAKPNGEWLGEGLGGLKESRLWFRENIVFPESGVYSIKVTHAMRENGVVEGLDVLQGVTDIGIELERLD